MNAHDSRPMPRLNTPREQREVRVGAIRHAAGNLTHEAMEAGPREMVDSTDLASKQTQATFDEARAGHAPGLNQVLATRRRLADKNYGNCLDCGGAVGLGRLTAQPAAPFCTSFRAEHEQERMPAMRRHPQYPKHRRNYHECKNFSLRVGPGRHGC